MNEPIQRILTDEDVIPVELLNLGVEFHDSAVRHMRHDHVAGRDTLEHASLRFAAAAAGVEFDPRPLWWNKAPSIAARLRWSEGFGVDPRFTYRTTSDGLRNVSLTWTMGTDASQSVSVGFAAASYVSPAVLHNHLRFSQDGQVGTLRFLYYSPTAYDFPSNIFTELRGMYIMVRV